MIYPLWWSPLRHKNNSDLPIVVEPIEAQNNSDLPIVVEAIEAETNIEIPIVVDAQNEDQIWFISYGEHYQGLITLNEHEVEGPYFTLFSAMINSFACGKYSILILEGYMIALLLHGLDSNFYLFDPHARNSAGMPDSHGTAVLMKYTSIIELEQYLCCLSRELNTNLFEIVAVEIKPLNFDSSGLAKTTSCLKGMEGQQVRLTNKEFQTASRLDKARERMKRKRGAETTSQKQSRLENARNYQKQKRTQETPHERQTGLESARKYRKIKPTEDSHVQIQSEIETQILSQQDYLKKFDIKNGGIHEQSWAKANINKFHKSVRFSISVCSVCQEAWPLKSKPRIPYVCSRCSRDKKISKKIFA